MRIISDFTQSNSVHMASIWEITRKRFRTLPSSAPRGIWMNDFQKTRKATYLNMRTEITWSEIALRLLCTMLGGPLIGINCGEHGRAAGLRTSPGQP